MSDPHAAALTPGTVLENKWIIIELIGKGAMGEVYRAHQTNLKRDVAIKIISEQILSEIEEDPEELDVAFGRFRREVQTMAQVRHPNVLTIYDYIEVAEGSETQEKRTAYIVMEYIPGNTLRFTLDEDGLSDEPELYGSWVNKYFFPILDGVEILHNNKIVHRDLKPENIFLDSDVPKIADFGLARAHHMKAVTCSIEMLGTLAYMSPEQCSDFKTADYASDIYALGKILYEVGHGTLTEKSVPFTQVALENLESGFLAEMSSVIQKATDREPQSRYQSVRDLRIDLQRVLATLQRTDDTTQPEPNPAQPVPVKSAKVRVLLMIAVAVTLVSVGAMAVYHLRGKAEPAAVFDSPTYTDHPELSDEKSITISQDEELKQTIIGRDGSRMILTGTPEGNGKPYLFYMDERKISNFLFVEFLNSPGDVLSVKNGIVRHGEKIIIYISSGSADEDVIVHKHNRFHLNNQDDGSEPVVRVTYHGAHLFASTYGKDLLDEDEWRFAYRYHYQKIEESYERHQQGNNQPVLNMMHSAEPAPEQEPRFSELDGMGRTLKEWVRMTKPHDAEENEYDSGVLDAERVRDSLKVLQRFPWEGFDDVGFRTKVSVVRE